MSHPYAQYQPGTDDDLLLAEWYVQLRSSGDLYTTFFQPMHSLSGFLVGFRQADLILAIRDERIWAAAWMEAVQGAPFGGVWIDPTLRHTYRGGHFFHTCHNIFLDLYHTLHFLTQQPDLVALAETLGYTTHGLIPGLWDGEAAYLLSATKESSHGQRRRRERSQTKTSY